MMQVPYYYQSDVEYAHKRLSSTFVKTVDGSLMLVLSILCGGDNSHCATGVKFGPRDALRTDQPNWGLPTVNIPAAELDMSPIDLGYIFCKRLNKGVYVSRNPMRSIFKQGLHTNALSFSEGSRNYLAPDELLAPMHNVYPNLRAARTFAKKKTTTVPFSRAFAVTESDNLEYMGRHVVGNIVGENNVAVLSPKYGYLQQHLDWSLK